MLKLGVGFCKIHPTYKYSRELKMEQLRIRVKSPEKAKILSEFLSALDFVSSVEIIEEQTKTSEDMEDFFSLAGLWENRSITAQSIRKVAWREELK